MINDEEVEEMKEQIKQFQDAVSELVETAKELDLNPQIVAKEFVSTGAWVALMCANDSVKAMQSILEAVNMALIYKMENSEEELKGAN